MFMLRLCICLVLVGLAVSSVHAKESDAKAEFEPVEVMIWNREITTFRTDFAGLGPEGRAPRASERINALPLDTLASEIVISEVVMGGRQGLILQLNGRTLLGLATEDVDGTGKGALTQAAELAKARLHEVFAARYAQANPHLILTGTMYTVLGLLIVILALITVGRLHQRIQEKIHAHAFSQLPPFFFLDHRPTPVSIVRSAILLPVIALALTLT